ncbi:MAG: excinuclease ABC subunit UvrC [Patescibacteria group bacterium]|jgi:excinuclease ABC subunit C
MNDKNQKLLLIFNVCYINDMTPDFKKIPTSPGVYFFLNKQGQIIYIGKAKNLKSRLVSYWQKSSELTEQKLLMLQEIAHIRYTLVDNETESLLLEASQIKKHQPKYNIVLKDDKNWGYIVITNEIFPRIVVIHGRQKRKGQHFGPYTSTFAARTTVRLLHRILPLRTCGRDLSRLPKGKVCLEYHMHRCLGPCEKLISVAEYSDLINQAKKIIRGETYELEASLLRELKKFSAEKNFELAKIKRDQLQSLQKLQAKQKVISNQNINQDIINLTSFGQTVALTAMQIRRGILGDKFNFIIQNELKLSDAEIIENFINQFYSDKMDQPASLLLPEKINKTQTILSKKIKILVPKQGHNKKLLELVQKNAQDHLERNIDQTKWQQLSALQSLLKLKVLPRRIEIYDISNIQGTLAVGAMVVFQDGKIAADQYRWFKIKYVAGPNDAWMMQEVLSRRLRHKEWPEPDLIILDGGKPQLSVVSKILPKTWKNKTISLAKKEEEIFLPSRKTSIRLLRTSALSLFVQYMRNQAHKFAIKNYRQQHRKSYK